MVIRPAEPAGILDPRPGRVEPPSFLRVTLCHQSVTIRAIFTGRERILPSPQVGGVPSLREGRNPDHLQTPWTIRTPWTNPIVPPTPCKVRTPCKGHGTDSDAAILGRRTKRPVKWSGGRGSKSSSRTLERPGPLVDPSDHVTGSDVR